MKYTFKQFKEQYPDDAACLDQIMKEQFGGTQFTCPDCGVVDSKFHRIAKRRAYACQNCGHHIYPCVGTIFEKSRTPLTHWFFAMYMMTSTRHGVAAKELQRQLGVTYKCAWRMAHEIRKLMATADKHTPFSGHIEIDETYVGGRRAGKRGRGAEGKTIVLGMVERDGNIRAGVIPNVKRDTLAPIILNNIAVGSIVSTDELRSYNHLGSTYQHGQVNHGNKEYANGIHHVNSLEGHWSILKRSIRGTHVHVSSKHLWKYISEFSYRRNMRGSHAAMFSQLVASFSLPRLEA